MTETNKTIVIFRKYPGNAILALFPYVIEGPNGECSSYMRVGQHGLADYDYCIENTKPTNESEYASLKLELKRIGYNLEVRKRKN